MQFTVRPISDADRPRVRELIRKRWGDECVVVHGARYLPHTLRGYMAEDEGKDLVGLATLVLENAACELVTLDSLEEGCGVGTALVNAVAGEAARSGCTRLWCITTNDNVHAIRFYQKRGFRIGAVHPGAVERARRIKPSIPLIGIDGIPIRDEIELEMKLNSGR